MLSTTWMVRNEVLFLLVHLKLLCLNIQLQAVSAADPGLGREREEDVELEPILSILQAQHTKILPKNEKQSTMDFHFLIPKCPPMIRRNKSTVRHRNSTFETLVSLTLLMNSDSKKEEVHRKHANENTSLSEMIRKKKMIKGGFCGGACVWLCRNLVSNI